MEKFKSDGYFYILDKEDSLFPWTTSRIVCARMLTEEEPDIQFTLLMGQDFSFSLYDFQDDKISEERNTFIITKECLMYYPIIKFLNGEKSISFKNDFSRNSYMTFSNTNNQIVIEFDYNHSSEKSVEIKNILYDGRSYCDQEYDSEYIKFCKEYKKIYDMDYSPYIHTEEGIIQNSHKPIITPPISKKTRLIYLFNDLINTLTEKNVQTVIEI